MKVFRSMVLKAPQETNVAAVYSEWIALGAEGFDPHVGLDREQAAFAGTEFRGRIDQRLDVVVSVGPCQREVGGLDCERAAAVGHDGGRIPQVRRRQVPIPLVIRPCPGRYEVVVDHGVGVVCRDVHRAPRQFTLANLAGIGRRSNARATDQGQK